MNTRNLITALAVAGLITPAATTAHAATINIDFGGPSTSLAAGYDRGNVSGGSLVVTKATPDALPANTYDTNFDGVGDFVVSMASNNGFNAANRAGTQFAQAPSSLFYDYAVSPQTNGSYVSFQFASDTGGKLNAFTGYVDKAGESFSLPQRALFGEVGTTLEVIDSDVQIRDSADPVDGANIFSSTQPYTIESGKTYEIRVADNNNRNFAFLSGVDLDFTPANTSSILIDYNDNTPGGDHDASVLAGDFTGLTDSSFEPWVSLGTGNPQFRTNLASGVGSNSNYVATLDRILGIDTGYTIEADDFFNLGFMWRDAANWDGNDTMQLELFYTNTDLIDGAILDAIVLNSGGRASVATWETESAFNLAFGDDNGVGKTLFARIVADSAQGEFSRIDNVFIEVVPEPTSLAVGLIGLGGLMARRRKRASRL